MLRVKCFFAAKSASGKGREQESIANKIIPHDQSSKEKVISGSSGGEYKTVPPIT